MPKYPYFLVAFFVYLKSNLTTIVQLMIMERIYGNTLDKNESYRCLSYGACLHAKQTHSRCHNKDCLKYINISYQKNKFTAQYF
jgi:hypothetical protein